jgi:flagellar hook assembly protein FlgD
MNDVFEVKGLEPEFQTVELIIVNSAGTEVFKTTNKNNQQWTSWDGKNSNGVDLPEGTYYYILMIDPVKTEGSTTKKSGFIVLKRR